MLYKHVAREHDWPTNLKIPNQNTIDTFNDTDNLNGLTKSSTLADMWNKLGI
jgi:DNA-damage-inducible protein J